MVNSNDFLEKVIAEKQLEVEYRRRLLPESALRDQASCCSRVRGFSRHLRSTDTIAVIAELKKAAPSAGILCEDYDVEKISRGYAQNGAAALSVLTDGKNFHGKLEHLAAVSRLNVLPVLRKDFIIDPYQVVESRVFGADAILLIVAALHQQQLVDLLARAETFGMEALVEIHNEEDLESALAARAQLIGINNRNLKTLQTSFKVTEQLAPLVPRDRIVVSESGIASKNDITRLAECGIHAVLIGSHLMRQRDPGRALGDLVGVPRKCYR